MELSIGLMSRMIEDMESVLWGEMEWGRLRDEKEGSRLTGKRVHVKFGPLRRDILLKGVLQGEIENECRVLTPRSELLAVV